MKWNKTEEVQPERRVGSLRFSDKVLGAGPDGIAVVEFDCAQSCWWLNNKRLAKGAVRFWASVEAPSELDLPSAEQADARAEDEAFDEVDRMQRRLGQIRGAPSTEPDGRALRERADDDNRVARLERNVDHLLARITMLEARLSSLPAPQFPPPYPGWPNPIITCGGGR